MHWYSQQKNKKKIRKIAQHQSLIDKGFRYVKWLRIQLNLTPPNANKSSPVAVTISLLQWPDFNKPIS
jgi:hypothetical protein